MLTWLSMQHLEEHTTVDESRIIKLAVLDGIKIGHRVSPTDFDAWNRTDWRRRAHTRRARTIPSTSNPLDFAPFTWSTSISAVYSGVESL